MGLIITLIVFVGLAAIIVWVADWTSVGERRSTALDILNRRLATRRDRQGRVRGETKAPRSVSEAEENWGGRRRQGIDLCLGSNCCDSERANRDHSGCSNRSFSAVRLCPAPLPAALAQGRIS